MDAHAADDARHVRRVLGIAIPAMIALWVGLIALAVTISGSGYAVPLAMGAGIGVLAGVFWASWYAFVAFSQHEERDRRAHR